MLKVGRFVRLRKIRHEGIDGITWFEFTPDKERKKDKQEVFVCVFLGTEPRILKNEEDELDCNEVMKKMGWVPAEPEGEEQG